MPYNDLITPYEARISRIRQYGFSERQVRTVVDSVTPEQVDTMTRTAQMYPWLRPGVLRSLAQAGIGPENPVAIFAAHQSALVDDSTNGSIDSPIGRPLKLNPIRAIMGMSKVPSQRPNGKASKFNYQLDPATVDQVIEAINESEGFKQIPAPDADYLRNLSRDEPEKFIRFAQETGVVPKDEEQVPTEEPQEQFTPEQVERFADDPIARQLRPNLSPDEFRDYVAKNPNQFIDDFNTQYQGQGFTGSLRQTLYDAAKPTIRTVGMVADYPIQFTQAKFRQGVSGKGTPEFFEGDILAPAREASSETNLGIALEDLVAGERVDTGSGFFVDPMSEVARIRRERERRHGTIGGHSITAGRLLADSVGLEPDTSPFNVVSGLTDAAVVWGADPTSIALKPVGAINQARHTFQTTGRVASKAEDAAGAVNGLRKFVSRPKIAAWINDRPWLLNRLVEETDPYEIAKASNFKLPVALTRSLADARDSGRVTSLLKGAVESGSLRTTDQLTGSLTQNIFHKLHPQWSTNRLLAHMPGKYLDYEDSQQVATQIRNVLINAKVPEDRIAAAYNKMARASRPSQLRRAVDDAYTDIETSLRTWGIDDEALIKSVTYRNRAQSKSMLKDLVEKIGSDVPDADAAVIYDKLVSGYGTHFSLRVASRFEEMADPRRIRRLTSQYRFLTAKDSLRFANIPGITKLPGVETGFRTQSGNLRLPFAFADHIMSDYLKPSWLLRVAWPVRVIGEEQIRIANSPLDMASMFDHPMTYFSIALSKKRKVGPFEFGGRLSTDLLGNPIDELDSFKSAMAHGQGWWLRDPVANTTAKPQLFKYVDNPDEYVYNLSTQLTELHVHTVSNYVANHTFDESVEWLFKGKGRKYWDDNAYEMPKVQMFQKGREGVEQYVREITENINKLTGGHTELLDAVRTGKLRVVKNAATGKMEEIPIHQDGFVESGYRHLMHKLVDDEGFRSTLPDNIDGFQFSQMRKQGMDTALDKLFGALMSTPTNKLSRSPMYKQAFWKHAESMMPAGTRTAQKRMIAAAEEAGVDKITLARMRAAASSGAPRGRLSVTEMNDLVKGYALDETKNLLYDLSERKQWADVMRIAIPFGDAYEEVVSRWIKITKQTGGRPLRRAQIAIEGLREPGSGFLSGNPPDLGFFHPNEHGEEVFSYPFSRNITQFLTGSPIPLATFDGHVQGLNMIGNGLPGLGPVVQVPAAYILQQYPDAEEWKEALAPFGAPGTGESSPIDVTQWGPAWARTAWQYVANKFDLPQFPNSQRLYASTLMNAAASLQASGEFGNSLEEQQRLMQKAAEVTPRLVLLRTLGQFALPSSPTYGELIKDKSGKTYAMGILARDYYEQADKVGFEEATRYFLETYGDDAIGAIIPKTVSVFSTAPRTIEQGKFWNDHSDLAKKFPSVFGFFGPQKGDFDYPTFIDSIYDGQRDVLSPEQWRGLMDDRLGDYFYNNAFESLGVDSPTPEMRQWLRDVADQIKQDFPSWRRPLGLPENATPSEMVDEIYLAMQEPELAGTTVGEAISFYLQARDEVQAFVQQYNAANGTTHPTFREAQAFAGARQYLRDVANRILVDYPDFENVWNTVFSREMSEDLALQSGIQ